MEANQGGPDLKPPLGLHITGAPPPPSEAALWPPKDWSPLTKLICLSLPPPVPQEEPGQTGLSIIYLCLQESSRALKGVEARNREYPGHLPAPSVRGLWLSSC